MKCENVNLVAVMDRLAGHAADKEHIQKCSNCAAKLRGIQSLMDTIAELGDINIDMELDEKLLKIDMSSMAELPPRIKAEIDKLKK